MFILRSALVWPVDIDRIAHGRERLATLAGCLLYSLWLAPFTLFRIIGLVLPILVGYWALQRRLSRVLQWSLTLRNQLLATVHDLADGIKD